MLHRLRAHLRPGIIATVAAVVAVGATGSAVAATLITGKDVKNGSLTGADVKNGSLRAGDLTDGARRSLRGKEGPKGDTGPAGPAGAAGAKGDKGDKGDKGVANLEADGPYPGATNLPAGEGDNSEDLWANDGSRQTSWVQCAPGKTALGGGFDLAADAGDDAAKAVQVVVSQPTQVKAGALVYEPITGDAAGSFKPNGWLVQGFNDGASDVVVRPWVVCADVG
jgi:hypothetical protein